MMESKKLTIKIIQRKKEVYYPIFTISISYMIYWIFILFISLADSQVVLPFLFLSVAILIFTYSLDRYNALKKEINSISKISVGFLIIISILLSFIAILRLCILILIDSFYLIPICIHFFISVLVYYILRREVKHYYNKKNRKILE
ncbi:MAG: hypothetical protein ACFE8C_09775, partial [Promethearchaeota archaeon]